MSDKSELKKLQNKVRVLEQELHSINSSRSYKLLRVANVTKKRILKEPIAFPARVAKTVLTDPRRIIRLTKGNSLDPSIASVIQNRAAHYNRWITENEPGEDELAEQKKAGQNFKYQPTVSIITPVFDPPVDVLEELIKSVLLQTYPHFELCLGNFGKNIEVKQILDEYSDQDSRVKVFEFTENKGIADNSNMILEKVTGEFVALLDHDDTLSPDALYENIKCLNEADYDFIFSDKDMMDEKGVRYEPLFKPDLSPETMLSANYLTHFDVMRTEVVKNVGGWDSKTDGAQDWDLFLKIMASTDKFMHIPKILYHWRVIATSTAHSIKTKPYALAGQRYAVQKYLEAKGIEATPYHEGTELLLNWQNDAVDQSPVAIVKSSTISDTLRSAGQLRKMLPRKSKIIVLHSYEIDEKEQKALRRQGVSEQIKHQKNGLGEAVITVVGDLSESTDNKSRTLLFIDDRVTFPKKFSYKNMTGWLSVNGVGAVGAKLLNRHQDIVDCGSVLSRYGLVPVFQDCPAYFQGYIGNTEWVRNLKVVSLPFFATRVGILQDTEVNSKLSDGSFIAALMMSISKSHRLVLQPKSIVTTDFYPLEEIDSNELRPIVNDILDTEPTEGFDRFSNPNIHPTNLMHLNIRDNIQEEGPVIDQYQHDALILSRTFDLAQEDIKRNQNTRLLKISDPKNVGWFLPSFDGIYAGLNNIFSFASYLANEQKLSTTFYILTGEHDAANERKLVIEKFPELKDAKFIAFDGRNVKKIPNLDIGICTQWATAYPLARLEKVGRKCYFIQDNETNFYPKGSVSALVELTYKLGFLGLANTPGLLDLYENKYGGKGAVLKSLVDLSIYQPEKQRNVAPKYPYKVFFYGRPSMPRNAFEIGLVGLTTLKEKLGDQVEIVSAGADWDPKTYGVDGIIDNLGKISYSDLPEFYRSLDAGLMFMFSGHPGVIASELMASGVPVIVNEYDDPTWNELYVDGKTCLKSKPTGSIIAENFERLLTDKSLRKDLIEGGLAAVKKYYVGYEKSSEQAFSAITNGPTK